MLNHQPDPAGPAAAETQVDVLLRSIEDTQEFHNRIVLVVDDEPAIRKLLIEEIKHTDPAVLVMQASNGQQALDKLADIRTGFKCEPVLIILDLKLPVMDGWEVIQALKKEYQVRGQIRGVPIIVLSATTGEKGIGPFKQSVHGGGSEYVPLVSVAKSACEHPEKYDATGREGLLGWIRHFIERG